MADAYVDLEQTASTATSPYDTWAKAAANFQDALTQAGAGGRVFVRIDGDGVGTTEDTVAAGRSLQFTATDQVPVALYGVKDATTAEPPTDSDLCVRGTDTLPVYASTGSGNITIADTGSFVGGHIVIDGISISSDAILQAEAATTVEFYNCELEYTSNFYTNSLSVIRCYNCEFKPTSTGSEWRCAATGAEFIIVGGFFSGTAPTILFDGNYQCIVYMYGVDLSFITGTLADLGGGDTGRIYLKNCKLATGVTRVTGQTRLGGCFIELIGCSDETALGSGESVRDYAKEYFKGTVLSEATFIRTGGANDGVAGFSYAITPRTGSTKESQLSIETPLFGGLVEGDATTSKDFTIYIANSSGADLTKADVWVEIIYPSEAGTTDHGFDISSRTSIDASAANVTDDTVSDWSTGAGGKNAQKIVITKTPDYTGPVYARVHFAQAGTNTLYVDPKVYVTDT